MLRTHSDCASVSPQRRRGGEGREELRNRGPTRRSSQAPAPGAEPHSSAGLSAGWPRGTRVGKARCGKGFTNDPLIFLQLWQSCYDQHIPLIDITGPFKK